MAQFTRANGDLLPVLRLDATGYTNPEAANALTSGSTVQPQGPKLDFFTITLANVAANTTIAAQTIQAIQQNAEFFCRIRRELAKSKTPKVSAEVRKRHKQDRKR